MMGKMICRDCRSSYSLEDPRWRCACGSVLDIEFGAEIEKKSIVTRKTDLWRYREALPLRRDENIVSLGEGMTPLLEARVGGKEILIKLEQLFPTGSYKDRGAAVLISKAKELGITSVVEDSSGNAGCSIAAYSAAAGIDCHIYVPDNTSPAKTIQIEMYGARLHRIPGSREDAARAAIEAAGSIYYASHSWNPFFFQGTKTYAYEIWEQLGFAAPDNIVVPLGNGTLLIGAYLGFMDLLNLGLIDRMPRITAVQSMACAPLFLMFREGLDRVPEVEPGETLAEGIRIAAPVRGGQAVGIVRETGGEILTVSDGDIKKSLVELGKMGLYVEPTAACAVAAAAGSRLPDNGTVVVPLTGHGLKSTEKIMKIIAEKINCRP